MRTTRHSTAGSTLVVVLLVLLALSVLGVSTIFVAGLHSEVSTHARAGEQALHIAEAGVNYGKDFAIKNPNQVAAEYNTTTFATASNPADTTDINLTDGGSPVRLPDGSQARFGFQLGPSVDSQGRTVQCGIPGFSDKFGSVRFRVDSRGYGPANAMREIEAHILLPPREGLCPAGTIVTCGYAGAGC